MKKRLISLANKQRIWKPRFVWIPIFFLAWLLGLIVCIPIGVFRLFVTCADDTVEWTARYVDLLIEAMASIWKGKVC